MKKFLKIVGVILGILIIGYFVLDYVAHLKFKNFLQDEQKKGRLAYQSSSIDLLSGSASVKGLHYYRVADTIKLKSISAKGFSFFDFILHDKFTVDLISIVQPHISIHKQEKKTGKSSKKIKFKRPLIIDKLEILNGQLNQFNGNKNVLMVRDFSIVLNAIKLSKKTLSEKIPFNYGAYRITAQDLNVYVNKLEDLNLRRIEINQNSIKARDLSLNSTYSRKDYINVIPYQKDQIDLKLEKLDVNDYNFKYINGEPQFTAKKIILSKSDLGIYRDKTIKEDTRKKKLYSSMLRELPIRLNIDSILIDQTKITYEERLENAKKPGKIFFEDVNVKMDDITNINLDRDDFPSTNIDITTRFMGTTDLKVNWSFKIKDKQDHFKINGNTGVIPPRAMNPFFVPAFNVKADGQIDALYFNFIGDSEDAHGDFKMVYDNFKVKVLRKNRKDKNGFLSFVANLFVNNDNDASKKSVHISDVDRDKTKSFWNYFWKCIEAGLKKTVI